MTSDELQRLAEHCKLKLAYDKLHTAVKYAHEQRADDKCWMDIDKIFEAAGLPIPDKGVGDKFQMIKNCVRFVDGCETGNWKSYAELEKEIENLKKEIVYLNLPDTYKQE